MKNGNPPFNMTRGAATMTAAPPFDFENVILRVFPLRADIHALRLFCDRFLNIAPDYVLFEPAAPYVIVETINYGKMSPEASNFGWVSQNEVVFAVMLNWYEIKNGEPVFKDTASVCPFIFVDEETSVRGGREVFGWPKSLAWLTPGIDAWARDPRSPRTLFTLSAMVFPELFAGQRQETRVLFEIEQEPPLSAAEFPINPFNELNPMVALPRTVMSSMKMAGDLFQNLVRPQIQGFPLPGLRGPRAEKRVAGAGFRTAPPWDLLRNALGNLNPFADLPPANTINLKQFRDSAKPEEICYQALVNAKMTTKSVKRGGLLGQQAMALGDPSGGYSLKLHRHKAWPIIESLGLEVASEATEYGQQVATLKPVMPNWMEQDFHYGTGEVLCWRSYHTDWAPPPRKGSLDLDKFRCPPKPDPPDPSARHCRPHRFNTAQGGSLDQVRGPFHFNDVTMRVLPLLADEKKLQAFCDGYLNHRKNGFKEGPAHGDELEAVLDRKGSGPEDGLPNNLFRAWGKYVYLIVTNFDEMTSDLNVGWWARRQVAFAFPVKWYRYKEPNWSLVSTALVSPFIYADSSVAATTGREMQGRPVVKADIEAPSSAWLDESGPSKAGELLKLSADVYPALNVDQKIERRTLLEITGRDVLDRDDEEGWRQVAKDWGETLVGELGEKESYEDPDDEGSNSRVLGTLKGLGLEILSGRRPINHLSLKQFRDAEDPNTACYQAITLSPETLTRVFDLREIDQRLHVAIYRFPSQAIVETLGLQVKRGDTSGGDVVDYLQPIRPFWLRANVESHLGRDIFWRAGGSKWNPTVQELIDEPHLAGAISALEVTGIEKGDVRSQDPSEKERDLLLFFERTEPIQFGRWEAQLVDEVHQYKRLIQDLGSKLTSEEFERWKHERAWVRSKSRFEFSEPPSPKEVAERSRFHLERTGITPQIALESILSNEWLNFGLTRWEQAMAPKMGEFDRRIRELASGEGSELRTALKLHAKLQADLQNESWDEQKKAILEKELNVTDRSAPPPRKAFVIRQDTIGHPEIRKSFEGLYGLERLDDDYWYFVSEYHKAEQEEIRQAIRTFAWEEFSESWAEELDSLCKTAHEITSLDPLPEKLIVELRRQGRIPDDLKVELDRRRRSVDDLSKSLNDRLENARRSRQFEETYLYIEQRIQEAREDWGGLSELIAKDDLSDEEERKRQEEDSLMAVRISYLGARRKKTLEEHGLTTVQDLSKQEPKDVAGLLAKHGVSEDMAKQIVADAMSFLGEAEG